MINYKFLFILLIFLFLGKSNYSQALEPLKLKDEIIFYSDKLDIYQENIMILEGRALVIYNDLTIEADKLNLDLKNGFVNVKGNIRLIQNDIQVEAEQIDIDIKNETLSIKNSLVNLNNIISFKSKSIYLTNKFAQVEGIIFTDNDSKNPIDYQVTLEKLNIRTYYEGQYFYLTGEGINTNFFKLGEILPVNIPIYQQFIRNPNDPRKYYKQRRPRNLFGQGDFFNFFGVDGYRGAWFSTTATYFGNDYSNGLFNGGYGLFTGLNLGINQDLTDKKGNFIQFNSRWQQANRYQKQASLYMDLNLLHDWKYDTISFRNSMNNFLGDSATYTVPEFRLNSIFRVEDYTKIQYKYDLRATRYVIDNVKTAPRDVGRIRLQGDINSPVIPINEKISFQALGEGIFSRYISLNNQIGLTGQLEMRHEVFNFLEYYLRYRQRKVFGQSPISFDNLTDYGFASIQFNYAITDFLEIGNFTEFSVFERKFSNIDFVIGYLTDYYALTFLVDALNLGVNVKFNVNYF